MNGLVLIVHCPSVRSHVSWYPSWTHPFDWANLLNVSFLSSAAVDHYFKDMKSIPSVAQRFHTDVQVIHSYGRFGLAGFLRLASLLIFDTWLRIPGLQFSNGAAEVFPRCMNSVTPTIILSILRWPLWSLLRPVDLVAWFSGRSLAQQEQCGQISEHEDLWIWFLMFNSISSALLKALQADCYLLLSSCSRSLVMLIS